MSMNILKINGIALADIYVDASLSENKPQKNVETISIPGRSGDLVVDYGTWKNVIITYPCFAKSLAAFQAVINQLGLLSGYQRIECSNDTTHFRLGVPIIPQAPEVKRISQDIYFDLSFNCKPQRFLLSGETPIPITASVQLQNPTKFVARPIIHVTAAGNIQDINGVGVTIAPFTGDYIDIDCELMESYRVASGNTISMNQYVTLSPNKYPELITNTPIVKGSATYDIIPRWWEL